MRPKIRVYILHETVSESIFKDIFTLIMVLCIMGLGYYLNYVALEWLGFAMVFIFLIQRMRMTINESPFMSPQQAANHLFAIYGVKAK